MTRYEKGVYLGKPDTPLSAETLRVLRGRHSRMSDTRVSGGGGGAPTASGAASGITVAPPTGSDLDAKIAVPRRKTEFQLATDPGRQGRWR